MLDRHLAFPPGSGGLSAAECQTALSLAVDLSTSGQPGKVGAGELVPEVRRSAVSWLEHSSDSAWLFSRVYSLAFAANDAANWDFDLSGPYRNLQIATYTDTDLGMYDWHLDLGDGNARVRKISVAIELAAADEGGILQFRPGPNPRSIAAIPGTAVVFPAFLPHRLTPVTRGRRVSLVSWICGPQFR